MLHELVSRHAQTLLAELRDANGRDVPRYVDRELAEYLRCSILAHGFVRVHCQACNGEFFVGPGLPAPFDLSGPDSGRTSPSFGRVGHVPALRPLPRNKAPMWRLLEEETRFRVLLSRWRCSSCGRKAVTCRGATPAECGCRPRRGAI